MAQNAYIFNQLVSLLPRDHFEYLVGKYGGNLYVKHYTCWNHFLVLLWAQLTGRESIRDIESSLRAHSDKLYRLGMGTGVSRNNIAHASLTRPVGIFRDFAQRVMECALRSASPKDSALSRIAESLSVNGFLAIDSSLIRFDIERFPWSSEQQGKGGLKLHTMYDTLREMPALCLLTGHEMRDQTFMDDYPYRKGAVYMLDKAYVKTPSLYAIDRAGAYFVVRRKRRMAYEVLESYPVSDPLVYADRRIRFKLRWAREGYPAPLRIVQYYSPERNELLEFLSNNFTLGAGSIALAYKNRWTVELFFLWIKQHLYVTRFYGVSPNAVAMQIYVAVVAYSLVALAGAAYGFKGSSYELLRVLSVSTMERRSLRELIDRYGNPLLDDRHTAGETPSLFDGLF